MIHILGWIYGVIVRQVKPLKPERTGLTEMQPFYVFRLYFGVATIIETRCIVKFILCPLCQQLDVRGFKWSGGNLQLEFFFRLLQVHERKRKVSSNFAKSGSANWDIYFQFSRTEERKTHVRHVPLTSAPWRQGRVDMDESETSLVLHCECQASQGYIVDPVSKPNPEALELLWSFRDELVQ